MTYYRRKILLALVERFGGKLKRTDCQKLLLLFCKQSQRNFYDFFPYQFGGFSFLSYQDKIYLTERGLLKEGEDFELVAASHSFGSQLTPRDQDLLNAFFGEIKSCRGNELIREAYLRYPQYACRSRVLHQVLDETEIDRSKIWWNLDESPCLFSIGYEGRTIDAYLDVLISNNVKALVDVRNNPTSMKYGFSKDKLQDYVERAGVRYYHLSGLGVPSHLRQNLGSFKDYRRLFNLYSSQILPNQHEAIEALSSSMAEHSRIALTCFERDFHFCHRHKITEYLEKQPDFKTKVVHL